jgi:hypothetical protein
MPSVVIAGAAKQARVAAAWHAHARQGQHGVVRAVLSCYAQKVQPVFQSFR